MKKQEYSEQEERKIKETQCKVLGHDFDEFHLYEVVCSRCRICRPYQKEDEINLREKMNRFRNGR